jgi:hypothetical protein
MIAAGQDTQNRHLSPTERGACVTRFSRRHTAGAPNPERTSTVP